MTRGYPADPNRTDAEVPAFSHRRALLLARKPADGMELV
jgi:hypothetical protein